MAMLGTALLPLQTLLAEPARAAGSLSLPFRSKTYVHRWSKAGQHEFTPPDDAALTRWRDMLTLNVHGSVHSGEALAEVANSVVANYKQHGKVLQTRSVLRSATRPAEHFMAAVLGRPDFLEAAFARCVLVENTGLVLVASHRIHGQKVGPTMSEWLAAQGSATEQALMAWSSWPGLSSLQRLPQSGS